MTELEKLDAGMEYDFWDEGVNSRKLHAIEGCAKLNAIPVTEDTAREAAVRELFGSVGSHPTVLPVFSCDNGKNIHVGENFLANYNVTILDIAPVTIGDYVMIGPNTLIATVNHPLSPRKRRGAYRAGKTCFHWQGCVDWRELHDFAGRDDWKQRSNCCRSRGDERCPGQLRCWRCTGENDPGN